jgi:hypothetical protein
MGPSTLEVVRGTEEPISCTADESTDVVDSETATLSCRLSAAVTLLIPPSDCNASSTLVVVVSFGITATDFVNTIANIVEQKYRIDGILEMRSKFFLQFRTQPESNIPHIMNSQNN